MQSAVCRLHTRNLDYSHNITKSVEMEDRLFEQVKLLIETLSHAGF